MKKVFTKSSCVRYKKYSPKVKAVIYLCFCAFLPLHGYCKMNRGRSMKEYVINRSDKLL